MKLSNQVALRNQKNYKSSGGFRVASLLASFVLATSGCAPESIPAPDRSAREVSQPVVKVAGLPQPGAASGDANASQASLPRGDGSTVSLKRNGDAWQLIHNGSPYIIKGAGGEGSLEKLAAAGGNSIRSWGVDDTAATRKRLDEAHRLGLTSALGIWLEHERHGFDYRDYDAVLKQIDDTLTHVREFKDHPALLVWGIGNEMEGDGSNAAVWSHIEHLAQRVKQIDPHHPVMTVIAEMGGKKIEAIHRLCPSVDIIGINSYGGATSVPERYKRLGGTKPYVVTEFGPTGTWEVPKNSVDAISELTSTEKALSYKRAAEAFAADGNNCLGSYAFLWGNKQEGTATWFGMLLPDGRRTAAADTMAEIWSGEPPANQSPVIESLELDGAPLVDPDATVKLQLKASDPESDSLKVRWVVTGEADSYATGGDVQKEPEEVKDAVVEGTLQGATVKLPAEGGVYRIYAYVDDGDAGGAATANVSVRVKGAPGPLENPGKAVTLPLVVDDEPGQNLLPDGSPYYVPSGFMGSTDALTVEPSETDPHTGKTCTRVKYAIAGQWGGVVWQHPENDWGSEPGGFDLTGAKQFSFWARGARGGEEVKFGFGVIGRDQPYFDTAKKEIAVTLTQQWKQHVIDLTGEDLQRIKSGFFFSLAGQGRPVEFYIDRVAFE